ncbi:MarC family protein [Xylanimonas sp. McL0601]|uniref:MarC family protein n=1 Tax=Xylanimonas sp. McL0601 TaxID=3414739 RepID=UPI003CFA3F08
MTQLIDVTLFTEVFVTLFVIMDPPGTVPVFLALTSRMTAHQRNRAARQAILVAFGVVVVFGAIGQQVLRYMGISLPALQASGGLLLLFVAMELLTGKAENPEPAKGGSVNVALVPLGTPLLAGPGVIVATMVFVQQKTDAADSVAAHWVAIVLGVIAVHVCTYLAMRFANVIQRVLRDSGVTLITRIAGLLLAAIAIQMVADAVTAFVRAA